jgi:hypothetical protein
MINMHNTSKVISSREFEVKTQINSEHFEKIKDEIKRYTFIKDVTQTEVEKRKGKQISKSQDPKKVYMIRIEVGENELSKSNK